MKLKILFVDDEPNVLSGLRLVLRSMRDTWDMSFAGSGREGLELLAKKPCDVVVSDMGMPDMDGGEFLRHVQELYPNSIRLILSGYSDPHLVMKTVKPAHQFLCKPCDREQLTSVINRTMRLRDVLTNDPIRTMLASIEALPALPEVYAKLEEELRQDVPSLQVIGQHIEEDLGLTATLLKLVNSSFFGLRRHVASPRQAVVLLGTETIKGLVLMAELFQKFEVDATLGFNTGLLWDHCMNVGHLARAIAREEGAERKVIDQSFIAGLLHDVGKLALVTQATGQYAQVLELVRESERKRESGDESGPVSEQVTVSDAERRIFGASHAEMGAYLMALWGLDEEVVEAVYGHQDFVGFDESGGMSPLLAVHAANVIEHQLVEMPDGCSFFVSDTAPLEAAGYADALKRWEDIGRDIFNESE